MSSESSEVFTKDNLNMYLRELSKEYKRLGGRNVPVEIILIGGAAVIESYSFREMTTDIDAILPEVSIMKEAINRVGDRFGLPNGWLNADFTKTASYSHSLSQYSVPYRTFNQVLNVRIVTSEYLIAMKLRSGRKYKNDLSDIIGILMEQEASGNPITKDKLDSAVRRLYGGWEDFTEDSIAFIQSALELNDYVAAYDQIRENEITAKEILLDFQDDYPDVLKKDNVQNILDNQMKQNNKASVLQQLNSIKENS